MARVLLDLDPVVLARLRAAANRRNVAPDVIVNELLAAGLRMRGPAGADAPHDPPARPRPNVVTYDYDSDYEDDISL